MWNGAGTEIKLKRHFRLAGTVRHCARAGTAGAGGDADCHLHAGGRGLVLLRLPRSCPSAVNYTRVIHISKYFVGTNIRTISYIRSHDSRSEGRRL